MYTKLANSGQKESETVNEICEQIKCDICEKLFKGQKGLKMHIARSNCRQAEFNNITSHDNVNLFSSDVKYTCDQCDYESNQQSDINEHVSIIHNTNKLSNSANENDDVEGNFSCDECTFKSKICYNYIAHANYFHDVEQNLNCDICDYQTQNNEEFIFHLKNLHKKLVLQ